MRFGEGTIFLGPKPSRVLLVHHFWDTEKACMTLRLSKWNLGAFDALLRSKTSGSEWEILSE
jgi:hypothetical protein